MDVGNHALRARAGLWMAGVLLLLWLFAATGAEASEARDATPGGLAFSASRQDSLKRIRFDYLSSVVDLRREAGGWILFPQRISVARDRIDQAVRELMRLNAREPVAKSSGDLSEYGLSPEYVWTVDLEFSRGASKPLLKRLLFGRSPVDNSAYWKWSEDPTIYRLGRFGWNFPSENEYWADRSLLPPINPLRVDMVQATWIDSSEHRTTYKLVRLKDGAVLVEPDTIPVTTAKAEGVFYQTREFAFDGLATDEEVKVSGKLPQVTVRFSLKDGSSYSLETRGSVGPYYLVRLPRGAWVKVIRDRFDAFRRPVAELTALPRLGPAPDDGMRTGLPIGGGVIKRHYHRPVDGIPDSSGDAHAGHPDHDEGAHDEASHGE